MVLLKDGNFASAQDDFTIKIWNNLNYSLIKTLYGHRDCIMSLKVMQNGNLISGSIDGSVRIWDLENGGVNCFYGVNVTSYYGIDLIRNCEFYKKKLNL